LGAQLAPKSGFWAKYYQGSVDEYQDTNAIQSNIVHILAKQADTVAIVGDDDQSIYGWRGASAHYMQKFLTDFSGAQLFRLEDNYRSTKPILDAANALISNNKERLGKTLRAISGDGPLLRLSKHYRDNQEASWVIEQFMRLFEQHGAKFYIAVLMRTNAQSRPLEEALHKARLPYRMVGGMRFYDRKEIKDILAALRSVIYHNSDVDLLRVLDSLSLGIGKKTQEVLSHYAGNNGLSFFETMLNDGYQEAALGNTRSKKKIADFVKKLTEMRAEMVQTLPDGEVKILRADEALIYVIDRFGIAAKLEQKNDDESEARLENIEQLVQAAVSFVEEADSLGMPTLGLQRLSMMMYLIVVCFGLVLISQPALSAGAPTHNKIMSEIAAASYPKADFILRQLIVENKRKKEAEKNNALEVPGLTLKDPHKMWRSDALHY
jgi:DNA helicase-2/ATP-dependent DNA helicase PcrA